MPVGKAMRKRFIRRKPAAKGKVPPAVKKYVERKIHQDVETKRFDVWHGDISSLNNLGTATTGYLSRICDMPQDAGQYSRIGLEIRPLKLKLNLTFLNDTLYNAYRVVIFSYDRSSSNTALATPVLSDLFNQNSGGTIPGYYHQDYSMTNQDAFTILYDKSYKLVVNQDNTINNLRLTLTRRHLPAKITYASAAAASASRNALYMLLLPLWTASSGHPIYLMGSTSLYYEDA